VADAEQASDDNRRRVGSLGEEAVTTPPALCEGWMKRPKGHPVEQTRPVCSETAGAKTQQRRCLVQTCPIWRETARTKASSRVEVHAQ
jgi:hypothetical protein